jgi:hypothetical protein
MAGARRCVRDYPPDRSPEQDPLVIGLQRCAQRLSWGERL